MAIGENIRRIRLHKGLTQKGLGMLVGISDSMVRKYELGIANPRPKRLDALATALEVNVEVLKGVEMDTETAMHRLFQLFRQYGGAFDQSESLYFQKLDTRPLYERWMLYQADLEAAEQILDERGRICAIQSAEEKFKQWMDAYS